MTNKKTIDGLEELLKQLYSDEGRANLVSQLVSKGVDIPESHLKGAIEVYEKAGWFGNAAVLAKEAGLTERAIDAYEKAGQFHDAARVAKEARLTERAQLYQKLEKLLK